MNRRNILFALTLFSAPYIGAYDGNELLQDCGSFIREADTSYKNAEIEELVNSGRCDVFLNTIVNMNAIAQSRNIRSFMFCPPDSLTAVQAARIIVKYLKDHPGKLHLNASVLAVDALGEPEAFICTLIDVGSKEEPNLVRKTNNPFLPALQAKQKSQKEQQPKTFEDLIPKKEKK
ncbi:Rap1a/Tai family immunity protein [Endozoicomonas sp. SESOKO2]|uniref:Rap1a/Tai family immunity protein n=1 Tax=Endozoicomonas sp. SESOKO2 TaxID=2828743 RepID=UPI002149912A|nr:Rap1a/Tai family immunity protein [Endozoicomonas sp. SESOKO2]